MERDGLRLKADKSTKYMMERNSLKSSTSKIEQSNRFKCSCIVEEEEMKEL